MFWYQCRYCKVNFDQWEKLVTHRRDEHRQEFEALKRRSALLLRKQEEANITANINQQRLENREETNVVTVKVFTTKMKPTTSSASQSLATLASPPRRSQYSASKELDAKDLENQEISLCIPSSSINLRSSAVSHSFTRSSTPPFMFPSPASSPRVNGNSTPRNRSTTGCNGHHATTTSSSPLSFLTPPVTPLRLSSASSPLLAAEELVLNMNMNWSPPVDLKKVVQYHQISDDDEIEICVIPSEEGSCISVTKHSLLGSSSSTRAVMRPSPPPYINGGSGVPMPFHFPNGEGRCVFPQQQQQQRSCSNHVVIENLEDEFRMTCSNESANGTARRKVEGARSDQAAPAVVRRLRRRSHVEMLKSTGQRLKRLHSQLQQRQGHSQRTRPVLSSSRLVSASSSSCLANSNGDNEVAPNRIIRSINTNPDLTNAGNQRGRLSRSSNSNTSTTISRLLRHTTRASVRRPK